MVFVESKLRVADNSGAVYVKCLDSLASKKRCLGLHDIMVLVSQKLLTRNYKLKKKKTYLGLIVAVKYKKYRRDGSFLKLNLNRVVVFSRDMRPMFTRIRGPVCREIIGRLQFKKDKDRYKKIISYSKGFI